MVYGSPLIEVQEPYKKQENKEVSIFSLLAAAVATELVRFRCLISLIASKYTEGIAFNFNLP